MVKKRRQTAAKQRQSGSATPELVTWAMHGIQQAIDMARARLEDLEAQARKLRGATRTAAAAAAGTFSGSSEDADATSTPTARKKRTLSPEARNRIAEAQKRRWAKTRAKKARSAKAPGATTES